MGYVSIPACIGVVKEEANSMRERATSMARRSRTASPEEQEACAKALAGVLTTHVEKEEAEAVREARPIHPEDVFWVERARAWAQLLQKRPRLFGNPMVPWETERYGLDAALTALEPSLL